MQRSDTLLIYTKKLGLEIIKFISSLPHNNVTRVISNQLLGSATSVGANYRAVCRARSKADLIAKLGIAEEADETIYWLEVLQDSKLVKEDSVAELFNLSRQVLAMTVSSLKTAKKNPKERHYISHICHSALGTWHQNSIKEFAYA